MGCISSKTMGVSVRPAYDHSSALRDPSSGRISATTSLRNLAGLGDSEKKKKDEVSPGESLRSGKISSGSLSFRLTNLHKYLEMEQVAAGWPAWLSAVAGEAIQGWVPLKADSFEILEKIGQGTYSSVFRARNIGTGKSVALKKVRFDNFEPESVRFMAREIQILRRLDHPNIVKLEGLITSQLSCSIYLVFEYMEHDLAGLSSCPDIKFSESQVKCYMRQLLSGLQHCHSRGVMHRDIKGSNLLVNNEGILKMADFGLANFFCPRQKQPLTSRVVTLWYRPPELLLGSTDYGVSVDLWSVGCLLAELLLGKPILQGRTEVEQLHKIFKLCGSPPDEYWKKSKLPHATVFKPQHPYESCLQNMCRGMPSSTSVLIGTLLSVEPNKRGTASTALASEYFRTKPYACEPSSLPKYLPNKEIDAKSREESRRRRLRACGPEVRCRPERECKPSIELNGLSNLAASAEESQINTLTVRNSSTKLNLLNKDGKTRVFADLQPMSAIYLSDEKPQARNISQEGIAFSGPLLVPASSGFAWAKKRKDDSASIRSYCISRSRDHASSALEPQHVLHGRKTFDLKEKANGVVLHEDRVISKGHESHDTIKRTMLKQWTQLGRLDSFYASNLYHSQELSQALYLGDKKSSKQGYQDEGDRVEFSGPLMSKSFNVDELLEKHERQIRQAVRRSWFQRGRKQGK